MNLESTVALTVMGILVYGVSRIGFGSIVPFWIYCAGATCIATILFHLKLKKSNNEEITVNFDAPDSGLRNEACADCRFGTPVGETERLFRCKLRQKEAKFDNEWQWKRGREAVYRTYLDHTVSKGY